MSKSKSLVIATLLIASGATPSLHAYDLEDTSDIKVDSVEVFDCDGECDACGGSACKDGRFEYPYVVTCNGKTGKMRSVKTLYNGPIPRGVPIFTSEGPATREELDQTCKTAVDLRHETDLKCKRIIDEVTTFGIDKLVAEDPSIEVLCQQQIRLRNKPKDVCKDLGGVARARAWSLSRQAQEAVKKGDYAASKALYAESEEALKEARAEFASHSKGCPAAAQTRPARAAKSVDADLLKWVGGVFGLGALGAK